MDKWKENIIFFLLIIYKNIVTICGSYMYNNTYYNDIKCRKKTKQIYTDGKYDAKL